MLDGNSKALDKYEQGIEEMEVAEEQFKASQEDSLKELEKNNRIKDLLETQIFELQIRLGIVKSNSEDLESNIKMNAEDFNGYDFSEVAQNLIDEV